MTSSSLSHRLRTDSSNFAWCDKWTETVYDTLYVATPQPQKSAYEQHFRALQTSWRFPPSSLSYHHWKYHPPPVILLLRTKLTGLMLLGWVCLNNNKRRRHIRLLFTYIFVSFPPARSMISHKIASLSFTLSMQKCNITFTEPPRWRIIRQRHQISQQSNRQTTNPFNLQ